MEGTELIVKTLKWYKSLNRAVIKAGGTPEFVMDMFPDDLVNTLVRNGLHITYIPEAL